MAKDTNKPMAKKLSRKQDAKVKYLPPIPANTGEQFERLGREARARSEREYASRLNKEIVELEHLVQEPNYTLGVRLSRETLSAKQRAKMAGHIQRIALLLSGRSRV
jgi:hypothetical protein